MDDSELLSASFPLSVFVKGFEVSNSRHLASRTWVIFVGDVLELTCNQYNIMNLICWFLKIASKDSQSVSYLLSFKKKEKNCCGQTIYCGTPWARDSNYRNIKYQQNEKLKMSSDFNTTYNASFMQTRLNISASTSQKILCNSNTTNRHQLWSNHSSKNAESYKILIIGIAPFQVHIFDTKFLAKLSWRLHNGGLRYQQHRNKENN